MNSYATLTFIYALVTLISSSILYRSFRKKIDASAVYFLISELCMMFTCGILFLFNIQLIQANSYLMGIVDFTSIGAEVAILFSLLTLIRKVDKKWFLVAMFLNALFATFIELIRDHVDLQTVVLLLSCCSLALFITNYLICKFKLSTPLLDNQFMALFTWFELGMVGYGILRLLGYFATEPIAPRDTPNNLSVIVYSLYVVIGIFRYFSYIGLRITWVDPDNPTQNLLNKALAKEIEEKDMLLRGLIASNRVIGIGALASSLAHQLSQPLTTIALRAEATRLDLAGSVQNPRVTESLDEISTQSTKLAELVQNLRGLFSSKRYRLTPISLQKIIDEIIDIVEPTLYSKKINLFKNYQSNPIILGDKIQLQQVFINIFNNAIDVLEKSEARNRQIFIDISNDEEYATLEVKDNGSGIKLELIPAIFSLYQTTKSDGIGVGLWLSKTILDRHHGTITASNEVNGGAKFKIKIPISPHPEIIK